MPTPAPSAYLVGLSLIAHDAERRGATALARAAHRLWADLAPDATPRAGLARLALADGDDLAAARTAASALARLSEDPRPSAGLYSRLPTHVGPGLGQVGFLDPRPELLATRLSALLSSASDIDLADASALIDTLVADPDLLAATAALLVPDGPPASTPLWRRLFEAALESRPAGHDFSEHHARWREALETP